MYLSMLLWYLSDTSRLKYMHLEKTLYASAISKRTFVQSWYRPDLSSGVSMLPLYCNSFKESKDLNSFGVLGHHNLLLFGAFVLSKTEESLKPCFLCSRVAIIQLSWARLKGFICASQSISSNLSLKIPIM